MLRLLGLLFSAIGLLALGYLYVPSAHRKISDVVVRAVCQPGHEKLCNTMGRKAIYSPRTIYTGATALTANCMRGVAVSCEPAAQAWEALMRPDLSRQTYEKGCSLGDGDSCFSYYMFLTRNPDYVPDARNVMEIACDGGQGDHSACIFTTIVFEEEGRVDDALRVMKTMCDRNPGATECWSAGELSRQKGQLAASANYFMQACRLGESRGCDSYTQVSAQLQVENTRLPVWLKMAVQDARRFEQLLKQSPNRRSIGLYQQYLARWKFYRQNSGALPAANQELSRAKTLFEQSMQQFDLVTQLLIRGAAAGSNKNNRGQIKSVADEALSKSYEVEKVMKRYPSAI